MLISWKNFCLLSLTSSSLALISSCGSDSEDAPPPLVGTIQSSSAPAAGVYQKALEADRAGKSSKALKLYQQTADNYPSAKEAPQARFRQAQLLEHQGEKLKAFEAYNDFLKRYQGSSLYSQALARESALSKDANAGNVKSGFMFGSKLGADKKVEMLQHVRDAAPQASTAPQAQFDIGEVYANEGDSANAIAAYRKLVQDWPESNQAPEGLYRIGIILTEEAKRGNQDNGNLDRAREVFQDYLNSYPNGKRAGDARKQIAQLGAQDAQRSYDVAEFYRRKGDKESARFYYREVLKKQGFGDLHDKAQSRLSSL
jgi:outer membrane protein assembly factor BamD (BamD/ComL family)